MVPRNWFWRIFLWKFLRISTNFVDIFSGFTAELVTRNSLELVTRNSLDRIMWISSEWVARNSSDPFHGMGYKIFLGIAVDIFTWISWERFLGISADSQKRFLGISADFPQNCYLGMILNVDNALKLSNYTSWKRFICLKWILKNLSTTLQCILSLFTLHSRFVPLKHYLIILK